MANTTTSSSTINNKPQNDKKGKAYLAVKRVLDIVFSLISAIVISPLFIIITLVILIADKSNPFFVQQRVGKGKKNFKIIKFRTMRTTTDANVPTHLFKNMDKSITPVGRFLRKLSLDELPQLVNIFLGQMSFIGPRPALWNQYDLIEERDKWGANDVKPGLSGWAQINGRDELPIAVKARLDGEYAENISFGFDVKCFFGTVHSVFTAKGVKESGVDEESRPLRICMMTTISKAFDWFVSDSARNLASKGFDVTVVCGGVTDDFADRHSKFAKVYEVPLERGISPKSVIKSVKALNKIFKENKFDVIQYATPNAALCCTLAPSFKKIPVRVYGQWGLRYVGFSGIKRKFFKAIEKFTCTHATKIYSVSPKNMELAISEKLCKRSKIEVIGKGGTIGVDFNIYDIRRRTEFRAEIRSQYDISDSQFVFGYIGRLNKDKGIDELLSAYRALLHQNKNTRLFLIGMEDSTNPPDKELLEWAKNCDEVYITGQKSSKEVAKFMSACDLLVHPTYREGFSMVLQEAMAMKLPVVTTDVPGPSEVIEEGVSGALVPAKSDKALLDKMTELMSDEKLRNMFAENGRKRVEKYFARPVMLKNIYDFYRRLLGVNSKHIKYMYLTSDPEAAKTAEAAGVDRIFLDLEIIGKYERQGHLDTVKSKSSINDVKRLREAVKKAELLVRCNPVHDGLKEEIDRIIEDGADIIMLPYFKTAKEVKTFIDYVGGRVPTVLLFETAESVGNADEILAIDGINEVYIGLNDMHLSYKLNFIFELLSNGTVSLLCEKFRAKGLPYGFGGVAKIGEGMLKSDWVIGEHIRLGSTCAILSRTFRHEVGDSRPVDNMKEEIALLRRREAEVRGWSKEQFEENRKTVDECIAQIVSSKKS